MKHIRGFTLIELLVVIAIIGLLASVVLTSLNASRAQGRDTKRVSELQQILRAMTLDPNLDTSIAFTGCTGAHVSIATCTTPAILVQFKDPANPSSACVNTSTGTCLYSVSKADGTAGATYNNWQVMAYLEAGTAKYSKGVVCISYATSTIMSGSANCK